MPSRADRLRPSARPLTPAATRNGVGPGLVVVAVDCSPSATHAALYAAGLARRSGATLLLVHVCRPPIVWPDLGVAIADYLEERTRPSPEISALASSIGRDLGIDVEIAVAFGAPAREVARIANDRHADVVVAGASCSLRHRLAGSVSTRLARRRSWPVVTVP